MKPFFTLLIIAVLNLGCSSISALKQTPVSIVSWNIKDLGKSKNDVEIDFIANTVKDYDVIAIQEVVAGSGGPQAVARLHDALGRKGFKWDYVISEPTSGESPNSSERYAFIWNTSKVNKVGDAWLEKQYHQEIDREPYFITLNFRGKNFTLVSFHAITQSKNPESEIRYFRFMPDFYKGLNLVFTGDFNLPQSHSVFTPLRELGFQSSMTNQKTSLRQTCINNDCLASEFDNFFFVKSKFRNIKAGIVPFYQAFSDYKEARLISDHVPIFFRFSLN